MPQTLTIKGERFYLLDEKEYARLGGAPAPELPVPDVGGTVPAMDAVRAMLARKIIAGLHAAGISQAELARKAGVRAETVNRILKAKVTADNATLAKIDRVLSKAKVK